MLVCGLRIFNPLVLHGLEGLTVIGLLEFVIFREKRALLFAVGTLEVVDALGSNAQALFTILLFFLPLLDLKPHEIVGVEVLDVLELIFY